jgi:pyridoxal phosphate enzyme (YggS family)
MINKDTTGFAAKSGIWRRDKMSFMASSAAQNAQRIRDNLARVRETIASAAARSGRSADQIMLIGVTKYVEPEIVRLLFEAGLEHFGESRPQELWRKFEALADISCGSPVSERIGLHPPREDKTASKRRVHWHLIGHLQTNKVRKTLPLVAVIQSADSVRLLQEISREAVPNNWPADVLLEVNVSGDATKHGFHPSELEQMLPEVAKQENVFVLGLMTMAALEGGPGRARRDFAALRELRDHLKRNCPPNIVLNELSMGMSGDYEVAIEEGATIVRIGSALFEGVTDLAD